MKQLAGTVVANVNLAPGTHFLIVRAAEIAKNAVAGQFVHVRYSHASDPLLRRPISITCVPPQLAHQTLALGDAATSDFGLLVEVVGRGSALLAAAKPDDQLDLLGPLGRGFAVHPQSRQILLIAGGVGIAPLLALAREALSRHIAVTLLTGARTAAKVFPPTLVPPEVEYVVLTDDGTMGRQGLVTSAFDGYKDWADQIFACGPDPMLRALAGELFRLRARGDLGLAPKRNAVAPVQMSLEQRMGCAMGACYGCAVGTTGGRRRVCRDGPVFDCFEVEW